MLPTISKAGTELETRASGIDDPVERLRFLRQATGERGWMGEEQPDAVTMPVRRGTRWSRWGWVAAGAAIVLAPVRPAGSAGTFARERMLLTAPSVVAAAGNRAGEDSPASAAPKVWRVDQTETSEVYSNGLHVDLTYQTSNRPRLNYPIFSLSGGPQPVKSSDQPAGIVFHTTESLLAPFDENQNGRLKQIGHYLLELVRANRAYHYVIDRFGRVFSVVQESDAANHAGHSLWAGAEGIYINLNDSFLSIAFEAQTGETDAVTPAQIASARLLTDMLRSRYGIDAANCVTHAQVSVNPRNMKIGEHTDWAGDFPFAQVGLPDNYAIPLASMYAFGFKYDDVFLVATRGRWKGLDLAEEQVTRQASLENLTVIRYRALLRHRFEEIQARINPPAQSGSPAESERQREAEGTDK